jgi:signal transduction histidine kinase/DNA-binding NarL/FixJ family response regulator
MKSLQRRFSIRTQLLALFGLLLLAGAIVLVLDEIALRRQIATFDSLQRDSLTGLRLAKSISDAYGLEIVDTTYRVRNYLMGWDQGVATIDTAEADIHHDWDALIKTDLSPDQRELIDEVAKARVIADLAATKLRGILKAQDMPALGKFADTELYPAIDPVTNRLQFLADVKMLDAERSVSGHLTRARAVGWWRILVSLAALLFVLVVGRSILRNVYKGVRQLAQFARHARDPDYPAPEWNAAEGGELGQIHAALTDMRADLLGYERDIKESEAYAQAASRAKSSFLASMSHEIRTPMVGVAGMLELLAHTNLDGEQRQQVEIARNSAQSLLQIIGDILDFSKIEAGKLELNPAPVDLRALVRNSTDNFLGTASAKGLKLECEIDERLAPAHLGDALRLRQILSNFLSNALKFTERGRVLVSLERLATEGSRELIAIRVKDSGIGVSREDQARLFQPFAQAGAGGAQRVDSTGLGLSICRRLAELMSGDIVMDSRVGAGTTMSLVVRLALADASLLQRDDGALLSVVRAAPSVDAARREGSLILLADDHPTNRAVIARQLNLLGYACESAHDGETALQMWRSGKYALLLTDLHMPRRDGYDLAATIRADETARGVARAPIVAVSANVSTEEVERSRAVGIDDFLAKPTPLPQLGAILQRYLPLQSFIAEAAAQAAVDTAQPRLPRTVALDRGLIEDFLHATHEDLAALRLALDGNDAAGVAHEAHRIKGAAGLIGAPALAAVAARIEGAARAGDLARAHADADALEAEVMRFAAANGGA